MATTDINSPADKLSETHAKALEIIIHDAKNLLANINSASELLLLDDLNEKEKRKLIKIINNAGKELEILLKGQAIIIQIEQGVYNPSSKNQELPGRIKRLLGEFREMIGEKQLKVKTEFDDSHLVLETDWFCLDAALRNVIKNAVQASPVGGEVEVKVYRREGLNLEVRNQGEIPEEVKPQFFHKYITSNTKKDGLGIGTYITKKMIDVLKGDISFTSSKQSGTNIVIRIPDTNGRD